MNISSRSIKNFLVTIQFILVFFSSTCLWSEINLNNYLMVSVIVIVSCIFIPLISGFRINEIINNRYIIWVVITYLIFEIYGVLFLRTGTFNWDFVLSSGVLQICLTIVLITLDSKEDVINCFCNGCKWAMLFVCSYIIIQGSLSISNIGFGFRLGDGLSGNANTVATNIGIMLVPTTFSLFIQKRKGINWIVTWAIILLGIICMILTGSKKGLLVLMIIFIMYFITVKKPIKYIYCSILLVVAVYAILNIPVLYNTIGFRVVDMLATLGIGEAVTSAQSTTIRNSLIVQGFQSFWKHPILGGGMNYFQYINNAMYYAHNNYVELLNNVGIAGTLIYYVPFVKILTRLIKSLKSRCLNEEKRKLYIFLVALLSVKFILDWAMVSFSGMCTFSIPFLFVFEIVRRERRGY